MDEKTKDLTEEILAYAHEIPNGTGNLEGLKKKLKPLKKSIDSADFESFVKRVETAAQFPSGTLLEKKKEIKKEDEAASSTEEPIELSDDQEETSVQKPKKETKAEKQERKALEYARKWYEKNKEKENPASPRLKKRLFRASISVELQNNPTFIEKLKNATDGKIEQFFNLRMAFASKYNRAFEMPAEIGGIRASAVKENKVDFANASVKAKAKKILKMMEKNKNPEFNGIITKIPDYAGNSKIIEKAVEQGYENRRLFQHANKKDKSNKLLISKAYQTGKYPPNFADIAEELKKDPKLIEIALIKKQASALEYLPEEKKTPKYLLEQIKSIGGRVLWYAGEENNKNADFILDALATGEIGSEHFAAIDERLRGQEAFAHAAYANLGKGLHCRKTETRIFENISELETQKSEDVLLAAIGASDESLIELMRPSAKKAKNLSEDKAAIVEVMRDLADNDEFVAEAAKKNSSVVCEWGVKSKVAEVCEAVEALLVGCKGKDGKTKKAEALPDIFFEKDMAEQGKEILKLNLARMQKQDIDSVIASCMNLSDEDKKKRITKLEDSIKTENERIVKAYEDSKKKYEDKQTGKNDAAEPVQAEENDKGKDGEKKSKKELAKEAEEKEMGEILEGLKNAEKGTKAKDTKRRNVLAKEREDLLGKTGMDL